MIKKLKTMNSFEFLFFLFFLLVCFNNLVVISFGNFAFKYYHLVSLLFLLPLIKYKTISLPPKPILYLFLYMFILALINFSKYGLNNLIYNYIFSLYIMVIILSFKNYISVDKLLYEIKIIAWIILLAVIIKDFIYRNAIFTFLKSPYGHPIIPSFFGGGVNLEATWISLFGLIFYNDKKGYIYFLFSLIISALYASRVGILASALTFIFLFFQYRKVLLSKKIIRYVLLGLLFFVSLYFINKFNIFDYIIKRFLTIGNDQGSIGRMNMWKYIFITFKNNPLGYGIGNSITAIEQTSGIVFSEGNIHNVFLQMLLDNGFIGFIWYTSLILYFLFKNIKYFFRNSIVALIIGYLILSLFQFTGGEPIFYIFVSMYLIKMNLNIHKNKGVSI